MMSVVCMEEWKTISGFENYEVSSFGRVRKGDRILKPSTDKTGRKQVQLYKESVQTSIRIHRLVAEAFLETGQTGQVIDHIDRNPSNNHVSNLRWCSRSDNNRNVKRKNKSGFSNIWECRGKYQAYGRIDGKKIHIGTFNSIEDARIAYLSWAELYDITQYLPLA